MSATESRGSCLCGAVTFTARELGTDAGACHCDLCRKWGGGPLFALACAGLEFANEEQIRTYDTTPWASRGFCAVCGTHLFIRVKATGRYILPAGLFDVESRLRFDHQIFIDRKPAYYTFANETRDLTGAEVFAEHTGGSDT